jgi:dTDP-4-dehydrorhamnose 3,5-epimerase
MKFHATSLPGAFVVELTPRGDERGMLARTYCDQEFAAQGLNTRWPQCNHTLTRERGTIRGLHYQAEPHGETKLIRCLAGKVWDVLVDVRPGSATFGKWEAFELAHGDGRQLYAPAGFAHGFQCLTDNCELFYMMSDVYFPDLARGVRWDDPTLKLPWPLPNPRVSDRDRQLPALAA